MSLKIKWNDDRVSGAAAAVLLITKKRLADGHWGGLIQASLEEYRAAPAHYKATHPKRDLASARDASGLADEGRLEFFKGLVAAMDVMLARIQRNKTQFSSLAELDNYVVMQLRRFE